MVVLALGGWVGFCAFVGVEDGFVTPIENFLGALMQWKQMRSNWQLWCGQPGEGC